MAARNSQVMRDRIEYGFRLIFDDHGSVRLLRSPGTLARNEREMALTVTLPIGLFKTPALTGSITVNADAVDLPPINIELASAALRGVLGVDIDLQVRPPE